MSVWEKIVEAVKRVASGGSLLDLFGQPTPPERTVGFTIAMVALGAKLSKADGLVTRDEVNAFKEVFFIPPDRERDHLSAVQPDSDADGAGEHRIARPARGR